jgi:hypothetical protein
MFQNVQPVQTFFFGLLACLIGWSLARGINSIRAGQGYWIVYPLGLILFVGGMLFFGFGEASLTPPQTSFATWLVVGILFGIVFVVNLIGLPLLQRRFSPQFVLFLSYATALFFVGGFMSWMVYSTAQTPTARMGEMLVPVVLFVLGLAVGVIGLWKSVRGEI